jgi:hypothetical protein
MLFASRIYLTRIHQYIKGDAFFPAIDLHEWKKCGKETIKGDPPYSYITLDRSVL